MAAKLVVTGDKEIDQALKAFENNMRRKYLRTASRHVIKTIVQPEFKRTVPKDTGALSRSSKIRSVSARKGRVGTALVIDDKTLYKERGKKGGKRLPTIKRGGKKIPFFYAPLVEFGDKTGPGQRRLYRSLKDKQRRILSAYLTSVKAQAALQGNKIITQKTIKTRKSVTLAAGGFA